MPLNPDLQDRWIAALRSGQYREKRDDFYHPHEDAYCPLGVLLRVANPSMSQNTYSFEACHELGLDPTMAGRISVIFDRGQHSFIDIANWIKTNL